MLTVFTAKHHLVRVAVAAVLALPQTWAAMVAMVPLVLAAVAGVVAPRAVPAAEAAMAW